MLSKPILRTAALASALLATCQLAFASFLVNGRPAGAVYTMTNAADGNRIVVFERGHNGALKQADSFPTGGHGTGGGLGNQSGLVLTRDGEWLLTVNAGSAEISLFEVARDVLILRDVVPSGGVTPLSITVEDDLVYVLNGGGSSGMPDNITAFALSRWDGRLTPVLGSTRTLSAEAVGPAQVGFSPSGRVLVVTEKMTNLITTFTVGDDGLASAGNPQTSNGMTPFGFAFDGRGRLFVSEAFGGAPNASALSSYSVDGSGVLSVLTGSAPTRQTAACWVAIDRRGIYAFTTNTGSSSITGYRITPSGRLNILSADGVTATTGEGSAPIDIARTLDGYFYVLSGGTNTISAYRIGWDGRLHLVDTEGGLPPGVNGLAAK